MASRCGSMALPSVQTMLQTVSSRRREVGRGEVADGGWRRRAARAVWCCGAKYACPVGHHALASTLYCRPFTQQLLARLWAPRPSSCGVLWPSPLSLSSWAQCFSAAQSPGPLPEALRTPAPLLLTLHSSFMVSACSTASVSLCLHQQSAQVLQSHLCQPIGVQLCQQEYARAERSAAGHLPACCPSLPSLPRISPIAFRPLAPCTSTPPFFPPGFHPPISVTNTHDTCTTCALPH